MLIFKSNLLLHRKFSEVKVWVLKKCLFDLGEDIPVINVNDKVLIGAQENLFIDTIAYYTLL